jgi:hypothetical protein
LLERTLFGAPPAPGSTPNPGDRPSPDNPPGIDPGDEDTGLNDDVNSGDPGDGISGLALAELLTVLREPITWVFTLAERHAEGDPIDVAVIHRVRDAVLHRMKASIDGVPPDEARRIRSTDLLTVGSHLIGTLDPRVVQRVMQIVGTHLADVFTAGLSLDPSLAELGREPAPSPRPDVPPPVPPPWYLGATPVHLLVPCRCAAGTPHPSVPCGAHDGAPFAAPYPLRPVMPPWGWPSFPFPY